MKKITIHRRYFGELAAKIKKIADYIADHPKTKKSLEIIDRYLKFLLEKNYNGTNPAIANAHKAIQQAMRVITAITVVTLLFGFIIPIDSAAIATGNVTVISKRKTVQHLEGGIVKKILVEDGDPVKKGQPLMEISDIAPKASHDIVESELWSLKASEARLLSLQNHSEEIIFPEDMEVASKENEELKKAITSQAELFTTQYKLQEGKIDALRQRLGSAKEEITGLNAQIESAKAQSELIKDEISDTEALLKKGFSTKIRLHSLQRTEHELKGNIGQYTAQIAKIEQEMAATEVDIANMENDFSGKIAEELHDIQTRIKDSEEKLRAASDVVRRTIITAPSEGIVTGLKSHTIGGVIMAGAPIMDIIPQDDKLILEVKIHPTDIDVVEVGMDSRIVFSAYKSRRMPVLTGKLMQVSADVFTEQQGLQNLSYYTAQVEVDSDSLAKLDSKIKLYPGMPVEVFINTGSRSFISYLFAPITDSLNRAFREE